ncbi:MAG: hypothetical protein R2795_08880 [Saprospiraceae bacterium]
MIHDGANTSAPIFSSGSTYNRTTCPNGAWTGTAGFFSQWNDFTSTDASGCLTFRFTSDGSGERAGWAASIACSPIPTCPVIPVSPTVMNITTESADVSWTAPAPAPANGYEWAVTTSATPPASGTPFAGTVLLP